MTANWKSARTRTNLEISRNRDIIHYTVFRFIRSIPSSAWIVAKLDRTQFRCLDPTLPQSRTLWKLNTDSVETRNTSYKCTHTYHHWRICNIKKLRPDFLAGAVLFYHNETHERFIHLCTRDIRERHISLRNRFWPQISVSLMVVLIRYSSLFPL